MVEETALSVLVLGGTGMLGAAVAELIGRGHTVFSVARHPERLSLSPGRAVNYVGVQASWDDPEELVTIVGSAMGYSNIDHFDAAIIWVHAPYREPIMDSLPGLLAPDATVIHVWGSSARSPEDTKAAYDARPESWRNKHVFLGSTHNGRYRRWLTHQEISAGAIQAWDGDEDITIVGELEKGM